MVLHPTTLARLGQSLAARLRLAWDPAATAAGDLRFLTVLDQDETGEIYLLLSLTGEQRGPVYCWPIAGSAVELPFVGRPGERHRMIAVLTQKEIDPGVVLDLGINEGRRDEDRRRVVVELLAALADDPASFAFADVVVVQ